MVCADSVLHQHHIRNIKLSKRMEEKAQIIIFDDLMVIDETETFFKDNEQLAGIATSCLRSTPNAEMVEVWVKNKLKMKFKITNRGKIKKENIHPGWGGARRGAGGPRKGERGLYHRMQIRVDSETLEFLETLLDKKGDFVRSAIQEKRDREKGSQ